LAWSKTTPSTTRRTSLLVKHTMIMRMNVIKYQVQRQEQLVSLRVSAKLLVKYF
jgi:hypothetical protein